MSLNFELSKIENYKEKCWIEDQSTSRMNPTTENLIFKTIAVGMRQITEENWTEFYARCRIVDQTSGYDDPDWRIKPEDVYAHIGLSTNAQNETTGQWMKRWIGFEMTDLKRDALKWLKTEHEITS